MVEQGTNSEEGREREEVATQPKDSQQAQKMIQNVRVLTLSDYQRFLGRVEGTIGCEITAEEEDALSLLLMQHGYHIDVEPWPSRHVYNKGHQKANLREILAMVQVQNQGANLNNNQEMILGGMAKAEEPEVELIQADREDEQEGENLNEGQGVGDAKGNHAAEAIGDVHNQEKVVGNAGGAAEEIATQDNRELSDAFNVLPQHLEGQALNIVVHNQELVGNKGGATKEIGAEDNQEEVEDVGNAAVEVGSEDNQDLSDAFNVLPRQLEGQALNIVEQNQEEEVGNTGGATEEIVAKHIQGEEEEIGNAGGAAEEIDLVDNQELSYAFNGLPQQPEGQTLNIVQHNQKADDALCGLPQQSEDRSLNIAQPNQELPREHNFLNDPSFVSWNTAREIMNEEHSRGLKYKPFGRNRRN